jgi:nucleoside 2-deoxyribosyltransferase
MLIYLCGATEYSSAKATAWRDEVTCLLHQLGHEVYDPALDEHKDLTEEEAREFRGWKQTDLPRFQKTIRKIIQYDLDWVEERCDALVAYWDEQAETGEDARVELTVAYRRGVPVYLVTALPVEKLSGWVLGCASHIFADFEELREYLARKQQNTLIYA